MKRFESSDFRCDVIRDQAVVVFGYGAQGRAQALNLRDSGVEVTVGLRDGSASLERCQDDGIQTAPLEQAARGADVAVMLVPDEVQPSLYADVLHSYLRNAASLVFAHGYNIHYQTIQPREDLDILLVAPLGVGDQVRSMFTQGRGVPGLIAIHQDGSGQALQKALSYAWANGHHRAGVFETTFAEETETDLFAEQAVLCGGLTHLILAAFETLVGAGYPPELAYFSCSHEVKLIADLIHERGIAGMRESISSTAEFGDYTRGPQVINDRSRAAMRMLLDDIQNAKFAEQLADEMQTGGRHLESGRQRAAGHEIEKVGSELRKLMPWLKSQ